MTQYDLSPGFIKVFYNSEFPPEHTAVIPVIPNGAVFPGNEPDFENNNPGTISFSDFMTDWVLIAKTFFAPETTIARAEFWSKPTVDDDPLWIYTVSINVVGTGTGDTAKSRQVVLSYRTFAGHLYKQYFMDVDNGFVNDDVFNLSPVGASPQNVMAAYVMDATSPIRGRDNQPIVVPLKGNVKTNDTLRRKRLV